MQAPGPSSSSMAAGQQDLSALPLLPFLAASSSPALVLSCSSYSAVGSPLRSPLWANEAATESNIILRLTARSRKALDSTIARLSAPPSSGQGNMKRRRSSSFALLEQGDIAMDDVEEEDVCAVSGGEPGTPTAYLPQLTKLPGNLCVLQLQPLPASVHAPRSEVPDALHSDTSVRISEYFPEEVGSPDKEAAPEEAMALKELTPEQLSWRRKKKYKMADMIESFDWSKTSLGPRSTWDASLNTAIGILLSIHTCGCLWWGPELYLIYNDAYAEMINRKHPAMLGKPAHEGWSEIWDGVKDAAWSTIHNDTSVWRTDDILFFQRDETESKHAEETYHNWEWVGVKGSSGKNVGMFNRSWETTSNVLAQRRLTTQRELAQRTFSSTSLAELTDAILVSLETNPHDLPFAILYIANSEKKQTDKTKMRLDLAGTIGVPNGHSAAPTSLFVSFQTNASVRSAGTGPAVVQALLARKASLDWGKDMRSPRPPSSVHTDDKTDATMNNGSEAGTEHKPGSISSGGSTIHVTREDGSSAPWPIEQALATRQVVLVEDCAELVKGFESRSWGELPESALIIPVEKEDSDNARCLVLIVGLNTRRPFDEEYKGWVRLLRLSLSSGFTGVAAFEAQKQRAEELAALDRSKTTFFQNISHELRTPLTLIGGPIRDLLALEKEDTPSKRLLAVADRNTARLKRLVDMLMDVSRVEAGRLQGKFSPRQLGTFTAGLASLFRAAVERAGLEFTVECDTEDVRPVYVDPNLWENITTNLLGNAVKYTMAGFIRVTVSYGSEGVAFSVADSGVGIPQEDIPLVVERFHRVASVGRSHEGTGIGLSLTAELIKLHGGTLLVESITKEESPEGKHGSTFTVKLPYGRAHLPSEQIDESPSTPQETQTTHLQGILEEVTLWAGDSDSMSISAESTKSVPTSAVDSTVSSDSSGIDPSTLFWSKRDRILVVDDSKDMRSYLCSVLAQYCQVSEARNGQEALEIANASQPDLIVTDMMMPVLDGLGLIQGLKNSGTEAALIPTILITARAGEDEKVSGLLLGADDYLPKPFSSKELIARCHLQMQMGKRRIELERKFQDRTIELHVRAVEAEEKRKEAEEQRHQQELLVDVTSHEIRNPVSAILQNGGLVRENLNFLLGELRRAMEDRTGLAPTSSLLTMIEEDIEALDSVCLSALSQERIANDVLSLARIQLSTLAILPANADIVAEAKRIIGVFASECRLKRINLRLVFGDSLSALINKGYREITTDIGRLGQILINLLTNAIRFTATSARREIEVSIELRRNPPDDDTCIPPAPHNPVPVNDGLHEQEIYVYGAVKDSGPGLLPHELRMLFQRFQQASQVHSFGGSGLGLYVCRRICELMDGKIEVVSVPGEGSTFRFYVKALLPPQAAPSLAPGGGGTSVGSAAPSLDGFRCLIVEDNLINQKVLHRQLLKAAVNADVASDGKEGLEKIMAKVASGSQYQTVLMDLEMPIMDGLTAIKRIRELEGTGELPQRHRVFALTGNARQGQIDEAMACGMDDVILKPYKIDALLEKLRSVL